MRAYFTKDFKKAYAKRIQQNSVIARRFEERYDLFIENPQNEILRDHSLTGKLKGFRAFSITGDIRAVYYISGKTAYFVDIGSHNQVYGK